jgi:hypothetical protein
MLDELIKSLSLETLQKPSTVACVQQVHRLDDEGRVRGALFQGAFGADVARNAAAERWKTVSALILRKA